MPVLGIFEQNYSVVPLDSVIEFSKSLDEVGVDNINYVYPSLGHVFANASNPGHDKKSTEDAWRLTLEFLNENLK